MPREPRSRGAAAPSKAAATEVVVPAGPAPETTEVPPNKREFSNFDLPSAKSLLKEPIELGNPNPMRLHVKNNLRLVTYNKDNEKRFALEQRIEKGQLPGMSVKAGGGSGGGGQKIVQRPGVKRAREI
eukprot:GILI01028109.1.p1 GENE.GILI01028109.1~~GILI01028109.1.p1  ORF type:complete len:128 (-),score=22.07 GILI01028109.1:62-445(-)